MKIAICFLSTTNHHFNLQELVKQSNNSKKHQIDIYEYINNNHINDHINYQIDHNTIYFSWNYLKQYYNYHYGYNNPDSSYQTIAGIQFLTLIDLFNRYQTKYDIYLFYENDVSYFGKENLFDKIDFNCDILLQSKRTINDNWFWRNVNNNIEQNLLYHGLLNIYGLHTNVFPILLEFIKKYHCHHEGLISTFALINNFNIHYINDYINLWADIKFENSLIQNIIHNKYELIHPVKTKEIYNKLWQNLQ